MPTLNQTVVVAGVVLLSAAVSVVAQEVRLRLGRTTVRSVAPLYLPDNTPSDRYQAAYVWDGANTATCVMVIRDVRTEQIAMAAVDAESCRR